MQSSTRRWNRSPFWAGLVALAGASGCTANVASDGGNPGNGGGGPSAGGAGVATGGSTVVVDGPMSVDLPGAPKHYRVVRLTNQQWAKSVQDVLLLPQPPGLEAVFQNTVSGTTDFSNNELLLDVNQRAWQDFQFAAEKLAQQVTASDAALAAVYVGTDAAGFIQSVGRRAYRRPLTDAELSTYGALFEVGSALSGDKSAFAKGAALVIRALLQSPHFLYRSELGPPGAPLSGYEVAAKLSLWLRGTTPSDALLDAAPTLTSAEAVASQATMMLGEPAATEVMREFHRELYDFDRYSQISKVNVPTYNESLNAEYEQSSYLFFDKIFTQGLGLREVLTSTQGFIGPGMAALYGVSGSASGFIERDLGAARAGYFSQLPYLTLHGMNDEPDSIHRGVGLALDVLCAPLGPPAAIIPPVPPLQPGQTNRERIDTLTATCGGVCHNAMINPLGFAFEHFDGMGQYRDQENGGLPIDSQGTYVFSQGEAAFADNAGLMQAMAESDEAHLCYSKKLASFGLQRDIVVADLPWLSELAATSKAQGGSVKQTMIALARSEAFRARLGGVP